jgi:hypothetical protein
MKTNKLTGAALDWAVAAIEANAWGYFSPSANWTHGGPIIERELIEIYPLCDVEWGARKVDSQGDLIRFYGDTPLIAAMRCYVASKIGDEVEIPEELNV